MTQKISPFVEGKYGWDFGESGWNTGMDENLLKFSYLFDRNVDGIVSVLPSPVSGTAYFLTTDNRIYFTVGSSWQSTPVPKWFTFNIRLDGKAYRFDGTSPVEVESTESLDNRLTAVEDVTATLGTAAFEDVSFFATQSDLDVAESQAAAYTDAEILEYDQSLSLPSAADSLGFQRTELSEAITSIGAMLSTQWRNIWEYADLIVSKPDPQDPSTWDWLPAAQALVDSGAGVAYFPPITGGVYKTSGPIIVDANIRLVGQQAKRLGATVGTRIENTGTGDTIVYSNTVAIYDAGIENLGLTSTTGHALNIKYGAVRCSFKQLYLHTKATNKSCVVGIYNAGTAGVDYIGTYSCIFEGGEYIVNNVARTAPIVDFLTNGTYFNENTFRNLWITHSNGRPGIRIMCTTAGSLLTNNCFDGVTFEVCSGGLFLLQATSHTRITGCSAWDMTAGYDSSLILVSNDTAVMQTKGLLIENFARVGNTLNGAAVDIDLGYSTGTTIINHSTTTGGKIEGRSRNALVLGPANATVTGDNSFTYVSGANITTVAATIRGALAHTGTTAGFFGKTPVTQRAAHGDTSGATLAQVEASLNVIKGYLRDLGLMAT